MTREKVVQQQSSLHSAMEIALKHFVRSACKLDAAATAEEEEGGEGRGQATEAEGVSRELATGAFCATAGPPFIRVVGLLMAACGCHSHVPRHHSGCCWPCLHFASAPRLLSCGSTTFTAHLLDICAIHFCAFVALNHLLDNVQRGSTGRGAPCCSTPLSPLLATTCLQRTSPMRC